VSDRKLRCNVRRRELYENLLPSRFQSISKAKGRINAVCSFPVVDVREEESWNGFGGEEESNMDAVLEWKYEEGMRLNLARQDALDSA
jgi:hypothetical protein